MHRYAGLVILFCVSEVLAAAVHDLDHSSFSSTQLEIKPIYAAKWTDEDLNKAKQIIQYFESHRPTENDKTDDHTQHHKSESNEPEKMYSGASHDVNKDCDPSFDAWSIVWYIASFGGLIAFFLIVSCSEWCCRRNRNIQTSPASTIPTPSTNQSVESPPPAYDLFAPPPYESCCRTSEKSSYDIFVVPVHAIRPIMGEDLQEDPPDYAAVNICTSIEDSQNLSRHSHA